MISTSTWYGTVLFHFVQLLCFYFITSWKSFFDFFASEEKRKKIVVGVNISIYLYLSEFPGSLISSVSLFVCSPYFAIKKEYIMCRRTWNTKIKWQIYNYNNNKQTLIECAAVVTVTSNDSNETHKLMMIKTTNQINIWQCGKRVSSIKLKTLNKRVECYRCS